MNISKNRSRRILAIAVILIIGLVTADTLGFALAFNQYVTNESNQVLANAVNKDLALYETCKPSAKAPEGDRECIAKMLPSVQSYVGVYPASALAARWLSKHSDDVEIRDLIYRMYETGYKSLNSYQQLFELQERATLAHNSSYLLRLRNGQQDFSTRNSYLEILQNSERSFRKRFPETPQEPKNRAGQRYVFK